MKKAALVVAVALLLVSGFLGLSNGARELGEARTALQRSVSVSVVLYGFFGLIGAFGLMRRRPWSVGVSAAWAISAAYAASVASFAYHDPVFSRQGTLPGAVTAGVATLLIGAFVVWTARRTVAEPRSG